MSYSILAFLRQVGFFEMLPVFLLVNVKGFNCSIHYDCIYGHENCETKVFNMVKILIILIFPVLLMSTTDEKLCRLRNMFCEIKYIFFKI